MSVEDIELGDMIRVDTPENLLTKDDGLIGLVTKLKKGSEYILQADFKISQGVPLYEKEIVEILNREEYPEYYL